MRIDTISVRDALPVRHFDVDGLADVVVVAGPNGVGKTRLMAQLIQVLRGDQGTPTTKLIVDSTCHEESASWGKERLDLYNPQDVELYRATLQQNQRRRYWRSSVLQFESDRSIQKVQNLQFSFDMPDPTEEEVGWDFGFQFWKNRWQDTVHSMFRIIEHQKQSIAARAMQLRRDGHETMNLGFSDPMLPFKEVFSQLLGPKELVDPVARRQDLEYRVGDQVLNFSTLSSGEREVVNIAFDYLLRQPSDCIVFFDEPELHLHPELSHRLIQTLQTIGSRNQLVLTTHSPDIIAGALDKSVVFISPPVKDDATDAWANQALPVTEDDDTNQALRLLGHSVGIIALGRSIVLIEGEHASLDRETYGALIRESFPELVLVPSGGRHTIQSFDELHDAVLSKSLWGVEFFMLCDRDTAPLGGESDRLRTLPRYHLENYYLDERLWAEVFAEMEAEGNWLRDPARIRQCLREIAREFVPYATSLAVTSEIRRQAGNVDIMPKGVHGVSPEEVAEKLARTTALERDRITNVLSDGDVQALATTIATRLTESLDRDDETWKIDMPGKPILASFAPKAGLHLGRLRHLYLRHATRSADNPFEEVVNIFRDFAERHD